MIFFVPLSNFVMLGVNSDIMGNPGGIQAGHREVGKQKLENGIQLRMTTISMFEPTNVGVQIALHCRKKSV